MDDFPPIGVYTGAKFLSHRGRAVPTHECNLNRIRESNVVDKGHFAKAKQFDLTEGAKMKAAVVPAAQSKWEIREVPTPEPGPNQVLIRIRASGICYTDVHQTKGELPGEFPRVLGHEPVGEIVAVGPGVTTRKVGDRVGVPWIQTSCGRCEWCTRGRPMFCAQLVGTSTGMSGGHAEYMLSYADAVVLLLDALSYEQAAPIFCAGYTVWSGLRWADPQPGERVAVVGIGGLGHLAVQYAKAAGFETIAISRSLDKDKLIRQLGADEIVRDGQGLARVGGADVVLGTSNSTDAMADTIRGLRPDGRLVVMGYEPKPLQVSLGDLIMRRVRILGSQQNGREYLFEALDLAAKGKVKVLTETYRLEEIHRAYERVEKGQVRFRAVVVN
jgi:2-desacetyl-2-hydroxyethyl bacteriochlorophyllide A dehydrogenase